MAEQPPLFDLPAGLAARDKGILKAQDNNARLVVEMREFAVAYCRRGGNAHGTVNADDVAAELVRRGLSVHALGNAAGSLFRDKRFAWTGRFVKSARIHAHSNLIREWRLA